MYTRPEVDGETTTFGVSGKLWRDSLVMYDRATRSLWSQVAGEAVAGPLEGEKLSELPSEVTTWGEWKKRHPDTLVLVKPGGQRGSAYDGYHADRDKIGVLGSDNPDGRLGGKVLVYGMERDGRAAAVPFQLLEVRPVLQTEIMGVPAVVFSPPGENAALAYEREVDGQLLDFEQVPSEGDRLTVRDTQTGSTWSWEDGSCLQGPFEGKQLERILGTTVYWGIWARFHPETELVNQLQ